MKETSNKRGVGVGAFIIIGLLFLVGGVLTIGNLHSTFQKKMTVSTVFDNINGLAPGNNIWFSGVKIGTVKRTEFFGNKQVEVIMNINIHAKKYIHKDAKVKISTDGLIGNKILEIYGGTANAPEIEEGDILTNESILSTEDILSTFQKSNLNVSELTKKLANGEGTIGKLINSDSIYNSISATTNSLQKASQNAEILIRSIANFSSKLNKDGTLANELVSDTILFKSLKTTVTQLNTIADTATIFISNLKEAAQNKKSPIGILLYDEQAGANLKNIIINLDSSSQKLDVDLEAIQHNFLLRRYFKNKEKK